MPLVCCCSVVAALCCGESSACSDKVFWTAEGALPATWLRMAMGAEGPNGMPAWQRGASLKCLLAGFTVLGGKERARSLQHSSP